ncbi:MAG: hypothetical protein OYL92_10940 [Acidobacteriota bacterium]|nr:hypothetical protein [Acidobacteriota bacterium]MDE3265472.1 hypothetical protein [Acidobacteriota bacterium]
MPREILAFVYNNQHPPLLYGAIALFKAQSNEVTKIREDQWSAPFVISETVKPGREIVYGSAVQMVDSVNRIAARIDAETKALRRSLAGFDHPAGVLDAETGRMVVVPDDPEAKRILHDFNLQLGDNLVLLSTQCRNLFEIFPRLRNDWKVPLSDRDGNANGEILLSTLLNDFVHNRYVFVDGPHVSNLFSGKPGRSSPIARTFMNHRFDWVEYVDAVRRAAADARMKDLAGLLRGRLKRLTLRTPYSDIVFLLQNLYSFSRLFGTQVADSRYREMLNLLFDEEFTEYEDRVNATIEFRTPTVQIHEQLSKKRFKLSVHCRWTVRTPDGQVIRRDEKFRPLEVEVGYERLLEYVTEKFGDEPLLGFKL